MAVVSVLFDDPADRARIVDDDVPGYFGDLNLDQVVGAVTAGRDEYRLAPFFATALRRVEAVGYRQEVFADLRDDALRERFETFARQMRRMRRRLGMADRVRYGLQKQRWFADAVDVYTAAVRGLAQDLAAAPLDSRGLRRLRDWLSGYVAGDRFTGLADEVGTVLRGLSEVCYSLDFKGPRVTVRRYAGEPDYSAQVTATFEKFAQGTVDSYLTGLESSPDLDRVEAAVLGHVAKLYPDAFAALDAFCGRYRDFLDPVVADADREVQFYLAYLAYLRRLSGAGLRFCQPTVSDRPSGIRARDAFDIALADRLVGDGNPVVCNDFQLDDAERVIVVTGPNQGGKTTFARMVGQLHHLAALGCPVPAREATLVLVDSMFTHFEKQEDPTTARGKLQDDLVRIHDTLGHATARSLIIMNEIFTSTALADALFLGERILRQVIERGSWCVCVTFLDEWSRLGPATASMVATVDPDDPATRTFRIVRRAADGLAYAQTIAERYGLTYQRLTERIRP